MRARKGYQLSLKNSAGSVQMLKRDEAVLGSETDMFSTVLKIKPDIIAIGPDQNFNLDHLREELKKRSIEAEVVKIERYHRSTLDSSCKIIRKIKESDFPAGSFKHC